MSSFPQTSAWPPLPLSQWRATRDTLHLWTQVVGKVRLALAPPENHWWHSALYVTPRGLTTSAMPYGGGTLEVQLDFVDHRLRLLVSDGRSQSFALRAEPVADFYARVMDALRAFGGEVHIWTQPQELPDPIPLDRDREHAAYEPEHAARFHGALVQADRVLKRFRAGFVGKQSPVHFFWGSFDLAATRFSGRPAPPHPGGVPGMADWVTREAYSHEVSSVGWWPGDDRYPHPAFYAYAYPAPEGYSAAPVQPETAFFHEPMGEFLLPYEAVRAAADPDAAVLAFLRSTYRAAAEQGGWDREQLEHAPR